MKPEIIVKVLEKIKEELSLNREGIMYMGICKVAFELRLRKEITEFQHDFIFSYIENNKPTPRNKYKEFTQNKYWNKHIDSNFWWLTISTHPETRQIRIDYLTELIKNVK